MIQPTGINSNLHFIQLVTVQLAITGAATVVDVKDSKAPGGEKLVLEVEDGQGSSCGTPVDPHHKGGLGPCRSVVVGVLVGKKEGFIHTYLRIYITEPGLGRKIAVYEYLNMKEI